MREKKLFLIIILPLDFIKKYPVKSQDISESIYCWIPSEKTEISPEQIQIFSDKPEEFIVKFLLAFFPGLDHDAFPFLFEKLLNEETESVTNVTDTKLSGDSIPLQAVKYRWKVDIDSLIEIQNGYYYYDKDAISEQKNGFYFFDPRISKAVSESMMKRYSMRVRKFAEILTNSYLFDKQFVESIAPSYHLYLRTLHDTGLRTIKGSWLAENFCSSFTAETKDFTWIRIVELLRFLRLQTLDMLVDDALDKIISWAIDIERTYLEIVHFNAGQALIIENQKQREIFNQLIIVSYVIMLLIRFNSKKNFNLILSLLAGSGLRETLEKSERPIDVSGIAISCNAFYMVLAELSKDEDIFYQFLKNISVVFVLPKIDITNRDNINISNIINNMLLQTKENRFFAAAVFLRYSILDFYHTSWKEFLLDDSDKSKAFISQFWCDDENPWQGAEVFLPVLYPKIEFYGDQIGANKTRTLPGAIENIAIQLELMISVRWKMDGKMVASKTDASESLIKIFCKGLTSNEQKSVKEIISRQREWYRQEKELVKDRYKGKYKDYRRRIEVLTRVLSIFDKSLKRAIEV